MEQRGGGGVEIVLRRKAKKLRRSGRARQRVAVSRNLSFTREPDWIFLVGSPAAIWRLIVLVKILV